MTGGPRAGPEAIGERSMGADDGRIRIGGQHPFATPAEWRSAARRFRGRLVAPVTVWTAGGTGDGAGLTVYSELVEGVIEEVEPRDLDDPLAWLHGSYRSVRDLDDLG